MEITLNLNQDEAFCLLNALIKSPFDEQVAGDVYAELIALMNTTFGEG